MFKEFREFAMRGNVLDMAVGIIIGAAFGKIVASMVNDVMMPILSPLMGQVDFSDKSICLISAADGSCASALKWGMFVNTTIEFVIVAFALFLVIKGMNSLKRKEEVKSAAPAPTPENILLLREIRDALRK